MLTFDESIHAYFWNGQRVPGVTSILAPLSDYGSVPRSVLNRAADLGKAVHLACELNDLCDLNEATLDPQITPYLQAWRDFSRKYAVRWEHIEESMYHPLGFAGTADRIGRVNGKRAVLDIKTTYKLMPTVGPQLAAYAHMADDPTLARYGLQLSKDGTYHLQEYRDPMDWPLFASLLTLKNWCEKHSVEPKF